MIKQNIARFILNYKLEKNHFSDQSFALAFKNSNSLLVLMPENDTDFQFALAVLNYLHELKKELFILTYDYKVSLLPIQFRGKTLSHGIKELNKIDLPSKKFLSNLLKRNFDAVIDLNRKEQLFYIYVSGVLNSRIRIGFKKNLADKVYNIQIANGETNPKISYENLLSCLKMF